MKTLLSILLTLLLPLSLLAQAPTKKDEKAIKKHPKKVQKSREKGIAVVSLDTLFNAGEPYAIMETTFKGLTWRNYAMKTFSGQEVALINVEFVPKQTNPSEQESYWAIIFPGSGQRAEAQLLESRMLSLLIQNELIQNDAPNPEGENRLILQYPPSFSTRQPAIIVNIGTQGNSDIQYQTVERNRNATFFISMGTIKQDFQVIATYSKDSEAAQGTIIYTYSFFLPNGTLAAKATGRGVQAKSWQVVTMKDNRQHTVNTSTAKEVEGIAKYLSGMYYL